MEQGRLMVLKRDDRREEFSREKLLAGVQKACQKRPVSQEAIENLVQEIVDDLSNTYDREVPCKAIGERVMAGLRALDPVAYVRYASVYRRFDEATIERMLGHYSLVLESIATHPDCAIDELPLLPVPGHERDPV